MGPVFITGNKITSSEVAAVLEGIPLDQAGVHLPEIQDIDAHEGIKAKLLAAQLPFRYRRKGVVGWRDHGSRRMLRERWAHEKSNNDYTNKENRREKIIGMRSIFHHLHGNQPAAYAGGSGRGVIGARDGGT